MDAIDRKILAEVQRDGRLSVTELAGRVGLSVSPCQRRLRALERDRTILGYRADLDPHVLGLGFEALVFVTMHGADRATLVEFEEAVTNVAHVVQAQRLFGQPDYLMRIVAPDLPGFQAIYDRDLSTLPGVHRLSSTLVMKSIKDDGLLPL